jgi:hypothetical protein
VLTATDIAVGSLQPVTFEATASNGSTNVSVSVSGDGTELNVQPAQPGTVPDLTVQDLEGQTAPSDLGTSDKYRNGQKIVLKGLEYGQWYYVYLNKHSYRISWIFPSTDDTVEFILPSDVQNGRDDVVVLDTDGKEISFDRLQVTPRGITSSHCQPCPSLERSMGSHWPFQLWVQPYPWHLYTMGGASVVLCGDAVSLRQQDGTNETLVRIGVLVWDWLVERYRPFHPLVVTHRSLPVVPGIKTGSRVSAWSCRYERLQLWTPHLGNTISFSTERRASLAD